MDEFIGLSTDESFLSNNSSLSAGTSGGAGGDRNNGISSADSIFLRFAELEKKIADQGDEIVCLKSSLADVLRKLNHLECRGALNSCCQMSSHATAAGANNHMKNRSNNNQTPVLKSFSYGKGGFQPPGLHHHNGNAMADPNSMVIHHHHHHNNNNVGTNHQTPQRRYSSSTSLQSDIIHSYGGGGGGGSSKNVSPTSQSPVQHNHQHYRSMPMNQYSNNNNCSTNNHHRTMVRVNSSLSSTPAAGSNLKSMKRWSASQDIRLSSLDQSKKNFSGSMLSLHACMKNGPGGRRTSASGRKIMMVNPNFSGALKDLHYDPEEGTIKINIFDRQVIINIPTELLSTYTIQNITSPPSQRLKLEWAYGYRGRDCRHNLYLLPTGEIVYFIAAVVVLYNVDDQIQRHYTGHSGEVRCLTIHPNKLLIATGQNASYDSRYERKPQVRIWDSVSLNTLHIIGQNGEFDRGINCLSFSKYDGGMLLCVVDGSQDHTISLWEWHKGSNGHKISESKSTCDTVLAAEFHPIERNTLITIGKGHIHFWDTECGSLAKKIGMFEKQEKPKFILCMAFNDVGELLTGDSNGNVIIWHQNSTRVVRTIHQAHEGLIFDICTLKDGTFVTGGGKDRRIVEWDSNMNQTGREIKLPEHYGGVRTLTTGKGSMLIVGTTRNCILQGTMTLDFSLIIQGHTEDLYALAMHPTQNQFITAGYDRNIHLWDTMSHLVVWTKDIGEGVHSAAFSPDGSVVIIGTVTPGRWMVVDATTRQLISVHNDGNELIECLKFSPNGRYLAMGSRDKNIYIWQVTDENRKYNRIGRCSGHTTYVTNIDWDTSNTYIQSTSVIQEHLFWNATICRQLNNVSIARDLEFETHNCPMGFNVFGIWPGTIDGPMVSCCDRSHNRKLLATGDDVGRLNLYAYPANHPKCLHHTYPGHTGIVSCVRFLPDDSRIISIGGKDSCILQWSIT